MKNVFVEERVLGYQKIVSTYRKRILSFKYAVSLKKRSNLKTRFLVLKVRSPVKFQSTSSISY